MNILEHLRNRHLDLSLYTGVSVDHDCATFPLWNLSGQMVGCQVYRPDMPKLRSGKFDPKEMKYYTYVSRYGGKYPALTAWGLETLRPGEPVFICEGIFDSCRLHKAGLSSLALLGCDPRPLKSWLRLLPHWRISVVQGDIAGRKLAAYGNSSILLPEGYDVGDLPETDFNDIFK